MKDDGSFEHITVPDPGQNFADKCQVLPRTVTLAPRESQMIKMQHPKIKNWRPENTVPISISVSSAQIKTPLERKIHPDTTTFFGKPTPVFGITIPVIIRAWGINRKSNFIGCFTGRCYPDSIVFPY